MSSLEIDDIPYLEAIRGRLGVESDDTSKDAQILKMTPFQRVRLIAGWKLGDDTWADTFKEWCESQGLEIVERKED